MTEEFKLGDTVRVTLDGDVIQTDGAALLVNTDRGSLFVKRTDVVLIERPEPTAAGGDPIGTIRGEDPDSVQRYVKIRSNQWVGLSNPPEEGPEPTGFLDQNMKGTVVVGSVFDAKLKATEPEIYHVGNGTMPWYRRADGRYTYGAVHKYHMGRTYNELLEHYGQL